jgi:hypothetical protein
VRRGDLRIGGECCRVLCVGAAGDDCCCCCCDPDAPDVRLLGVVVAVVVAGVVAGAVAGAVAGVVASAVGAAAEAEAAAAGAPRVGDETVARVDLVEAAGVSFASQAFSRALESTGFSFTGGCTTLSEEAVVELSSRFTRCAASDEWSFSIDS